MITHLLLALLQEPDPNTFRVFWNDGLRLETADGNAKLRIGGRIHEDYAYIDADPELESDLGAPIEDGVMFRRARLSMSGVLYKRLEFKSEFDFATGTASFTDVYAGILDVPGGFNLRFGQFKEPFSMEQMNSSNSMNFMERSLPDAFAPARSTGVMLHDVIADQRMTWAAGAFRKGDSQGASSDANTGWNGTARVTGLVISREDGRHLLHLGAAASLRDPGEGTISYSSRPESRIAPIFISTGSFEADSASLLGLEAAWIFGRVSLQGEVVQSSVDRGDAGADADFSGWYAEAGFFLTDDVKAYDKSSGTIGRLKPRRGLFAADGGSGAWELKTRLSALDLNDGDIEGGAMDDLSLGVNWYLSPNSRVMIEAIQSDVEDVGGAQIYQIRFQVDW